jgi:hypothetical protein
MKKNISYTTFNTVWIFLGLILFLVSCVQVEDVESPGDIQVWHPKGKMYVHREGCPRLTTDADKLAEMKTMTLEEARTMGWQLCSKCPGIATDGLPELWVNPPRDEVQKKEFTKSALAPLVSFGKDGKLDYKPYSDEGDRILDFSQCGYKHSEVPIPDIPVVKTLLPPKSNAISVDNMNYKVGEDSFEDLQAALDEVAALEPDANGFRGAVLLKKGTWYLGSTLRIPSGVVLRGEGDGEDGTVLLFTFPQGADTGIQLGGINPGSLPEYPQIAGKLTQKTNKKGKVDYILTLENGYWFTVKEPPFKPEVQLKPFVDSSVILTMKALPATGELKHNMPYDVQGVKEGQELPPLNPNLILPEQPFGSGSVAESKIADAYVPSGSSTLTLEDASGFKVGDSVTVYKTTNWEWIDQLGLGERIRHIRGGEVGAGKTPWTPQTYDHPRTITAIDGNTITLDVNLPQSIEDDFGGGYVRKTEPTETVSNCGVENLRVVSNYDTTVTGQNKSTNYMNLQDGIAVKCQNAWVRNCTVLHVAMAAVSMSGQYCTIRDCTALQPVGPKTGGKRYTYYINGSALGNLIYNCYGGDGGRHNFVAGARVQGPNAFLKCTALKGGQSEPHHRWSTGILFDNITLKEKGNLAAINRGDSGTGHGWAGANMVFWNCAANNIVVFDPETKGENNFAIGYTGEKKSDYSTGGVKYANDRSGYWGTPQEGVYYGYALMGNGYIESPGAPVKPESLFEQQLIDRIGKEQVEAVLK